MTDKYDKKFYIVYYSWLRIMRNNHSRVPRMRQKKLLNR